jgi:hypothetical protein
LETFKFDGKETIDLEVFSLHFFHFLFFCEIFSIFQVSKPTDFLKFYSHEIEITDAILSGQGKEFKSLPVEYNERWQTATLKLPEQLTTGNLLVLVCFDAFLFDI